jgi:hypothetical protein
VALRLNGLNDVDIKRKLGKMTKAQRAAIAAAAPAAMPGWSDRVVNAVAAIDAAVTH